jgi:hypothetical protein
VDYNSLIINTTKMDKIITKLAEKYGFSAEEATEYLKTAKSDSDTTGTNQEKIATCKKNITLWEQKLAEGKVPDADKQREKIEKEKKKLEKLEKTEEKSEGEGEAKAEPKKAKKAAKKTEAKAEEKKTEAKAEEKEKRIKRFSPVMAAQLKKALEDAKVEMTDALKKEFQQYIEDLTDDDYRASGLADHMRAFATLKNVKPETVVGDEPVPVPVAEKAEEIKEKGEAKAETETKKDEKPKKAPKKAAKKGEDKMVIPEMSSAANIVELSPEELRGIKMTAEIDGKPGTYWDADNGRFVKGPESDDDEDVVEVKFNGKDYVVGEKTGRVYESNTDGDVFAGFAGVGKFKAMEL